MAFNGKINFEMSNQIIICCKDCGVSHAMKIPIKPKGKPEFDKELHLRCHSCGLLINARQHSHRAFKFDESMLENKDGN